MSVESAKDLEGLPSCTNGVVWTRHGPTGSTGTTDRSADRRVLVSIRSVLAAVTERGRRLCRNLLPTYELTCSETDLVRSRNDANLGDEGTRTLGHLIGRAVPRCPLSSRVDLGVGHSARRARKTISLTRRHLSGSGTRSGARSITANPMYIAST